MIESIAANTVITLPQINNISSPPIELEAAKTTDVSKFDNILQKAQSANLNDLSIDIKNTTASKLAGVEKNLLDKFIDINKSLNSRNQHIADIKEILSNPIKTEKKAPIVATIDNFRKLDNDSKIRTNFSDKNNINSIVEDAQKKLIETAQQSARNREIVNDKFIKIAAWRTNMGIFSATLKSMRSGFETLFRSSG